MAYSKLNQLLKEQIDELKFFGNENITSNKFILDTTSFNENELGDLIQPQEHTIRGRIFPVADIFKNGAFQIEIKLLSTHPFHPPKVRFLTPIYHPNVTQDGEFTHELLRNTVRWSSSTTLVEIVNTIVDRIDKPDIDHSINHIVAKEYMEDRDEYNRKALELVKSHALPRY